MLPAFKRFYFLPVVLGLLYNHGFAQPTDTLRILFIGNSLTYTNDLPEKVKEIGKWDGRTIWYHSVVKPDYSLEDHWNDGVAEDEIGKGDYDVVIVQQGPSALPESRVLLQEYAGRFAKVCKEYNTKMALYMVWPSRARLFDLDNVIYSYTLAARECGALLCPAGLAWKYAWQADASIPLYGPDNFHPGTDGTVLAALSIYGVLAGKTDFNFLRAVRYSWKSVISDKAFLQLTGSATGALEKIKGN